MPTGSDAQKTNTYWGRDGLETRILEALAAAGKDVKALTIDDLAPADQFHSGGKAATQRLARLADLKPGLRVLDVGGGFGGPARTLAMEFGCRVTVVDLTESYVRTGSALTARLGLGDRVSHRVGDALALEDLLLWGPEMAPQTPQRSEHPGKAGALLEPPAGHFDVVWTQNSGMNIADKERLYAGFARCLRPGALLAIQEPMAGPVQPVVYPLMWARDPSMNHLRTPDAMRAVIEAAGFRARAWDDITMELAGPASASSIPAHAVQRIVMGDALEDITHSGQRNREEHRIVMVQGVFERA